MMGFGADGLFAVGIGNYNVRIGSHGNRTFLWKQSKDLGSCGRGQLDEAIEADSILNDTPIVNQAHTIFDSGTAVRNFAEVIAAEFLLFLETEWTVVGRDHLKVISAKALPQLFLIRLIT